MIDDVSAQIEPATVPVPVVVEPVSAPVQTVTIAARAGIGDDTVRPMPVWLSLVVILLSLGAGGWIVKWYVSTDALQHESKVLEENPALRPARNLFNGPAVMQQGQNGWSIRCPEARLVVVQPKSKPARVSLLTYNNYEFVPAEQRAAIFTVRRILRDKAMQKSLDITDAQLQTLQPFEQTITMSATKADYEKLLTLWAAYYSAADKAKPLAALQSAMTDTARASIGATKALAADRAARIRSTLTPEQWKKYELMGR